MRVAISASGLIAAAVHWPTNKLAPDTALSCKNTHSYRQYGTAAHCVDVCLCSACYVPYTSEGQHTVIALDSGRRAVCLASALRPYYGSDQPHTITPHYYWLPDIPRQHGQQQLKQVACSQSRALSVGQKHSRSQQSQPC